MEMIHEAGQYVDTVKRVCEAVGSEVTFRGTVHRVRDMSDFSFVVMRVERGLIQCTFQGDVRPHPGVPCGLFAGRCTGRRRNDHR